MSEQLKKAATKEEARLRYQEGLQNRKKNLDGKKENFNTQISILRAKIQKYQLQIQHLGKEIEIIDAQLQGLTSLLEK